MSVGRSVCLSVSLTVGLSVHNKFQGVQNTLKVDVMIMFQCFMHSKFYFVHIMQILQYTFGLIHFCKLYVITTMSTLVGQNYANQYIWDNMLVAMQLEKLYHLLLKPLQHKLFIMFIILIIQSTKVIFAQFYFYFTLILMSCKFPIVCEVRTPEKPLAASKF